MDAVPIIDVSPLIPANDGRPTADSAAVRVAADALDRACRDTGFFLVSGHGVPDPALARVDSLAREFFALADEEKAEVAMPRGGRAWRGWFPEGGELTAGRPDRKEGYYFGADLPADDTRVVDGRLLHGPNLFPDHPADFGVAVNDWITRMTSLGHALCRGVALALGLDADWFDRHLTADPTVLFRIFRYPPVAAADDGWGVAEHTDYGLLTILATDGRAGLQVVQGRNGWTDVPAVPGTFVVNLGDMLERMTGGIYRSTPHRVRHVTAAGEGPSTDRLSFPFFFDPGWDAEVRPIPQLASFADRSAASDRWDGASVHDWSGTYGDYLTSKVAKVFPTLHEDVARTDR